MMFSSCEVVKVFGHAAAKLHPTTTAEITLVLWQVYGTKTLFASDFLVPTYTQQPPIFTMAQHHNGSCSKDTHSMKGNHATWVHDSHVNVDSLLHFPSKSLSVERLIFFRAASFLATLVPAYFLMNVLEPMGCILLAMDKSCTCCMCWCKLGVSSVIVMISSDHIETVCSC